MKREIKAILADIDGTLVPKGEMIMPLTRQTIQQLHQQGVLFGVASGRPIDHRLKDKAKDWDLGFDFDVMIGMNGGDLWDRYHDGVRHYHLLQPEVMHEIMDFMKDFDMNAMTFLDGFDLIHALKVNEFTKESIKRNHSHVEIVSIDELCAIPAGKLEIHYDPDDEELEQQIMQAVKQHQSDKWICVKTYFGTIEFQDPRVSKGMALQMFAQENNIPVEQILAFGDMNNDYEMIRDAGIGVCLLNGCEECKSVADEVTEYSVFEDGVGHYLQDHIL